MSNYIVMDLEWNQSTTKEKEVKGLMFEILEIGAVKLNENKEIIDTYRSLVKPQVYHTMHFMTQKIVHFTMNDLKKERLFQDVLDNFLSWCGDDYIFCTWGPSDLTELQRNIKYYKMNPLSNGPLEYIDIQKVYSLECEDGKQRRSLESVVEALDIKVEGEFHDALSDAYFTALVFNKIKNTKYEIYHSFDNFYLPRNKNEELHIKFPTYSKYISRLFKNKQIAINDSEVSSVRCNICNRNSKRITKWFSPGGRYYICIGVCRVHGYVKSKSRLKKYDGERVYVVKTTKIIDETTKNVFLEKYESTMNKIHLNKIHLNKIKE